MVLRNVMLVAPGGELWISRPVPIAKPRLRLFCFPHAGSGAAQFRPWADLMPPDVELCAVRLPGRETRLRVGVTSEANAGDPGLQDRPRIGAMRVVTGRAIARRHWQMNALAASARRRAPFPAVAGAAEDGDGHGEKLLPSVVRRVTGPAAGLRRRMRVLLVPYLQAVTPDAKRIARQLQKLGMVGGVRLVAGRARRR